MHNFDEMSAGIWHTNVSLKVSICVWRLLRNRWPTKDNLFLHGIISNNSQLCVSGCDNNESTDHLLFHCPIFGILWDLVKELIGVYFVDPPHVLGHFTQFAYTTGGFKPHRSLMQLIWLFCFWVLLSERNNRLFNNKVKSIVHMMDKVKVLSFWWMRAKSTSFSFGYRIWWHQFFVYLSFC